MTDEETKEMLFRIWQGVRESARKLMMRFGGLERKYQAFIIGCVAFVLVLFGILLSPKQDYSDPKVFMQKVVKDEFNAHREYYKKYSIEKINVLDAEISSINGRWQEIKARIRFVPAKGTRYYGFENDYSRKIWWWMGLSLPDQYAETFGAEVKKANQAVEAWNSYKVGLFRRISAECEAELLETTITAIRKRVAGVYVLDDSALKPFLNLGFDYYYTQYTACERNNCPALLCDANGPESKEGKKFDAEYLRVVDEVVETGEAVKAARKQLESGGKEAEEQFRLAIERFVRTLKSMPKLGNS